VLTQKVTTFIKSNALISPKEHIIVALSGGRDSVSLLYLLNSIKSELEISLSAVHINHSLRGAESDEEESFVKSLSTKMGIDCSVYRLAGFKIDAGENALRKARYDKYEQEAVKFENCKIATAHHLDDQLETYLMRLFKGSGPKGLLAIPSKRLKYIRPFLCCTRREINDFCEDNKIQFVDDPSNFVADKLRNKIRKNLTPALEDIFGKSYLQEFSKSHEEYKAYYQEYRQYNFMDFEKYYIKEKQQLCIEKQDYLAFSKNGKLHFLEYCFSCIYGLPFTVQSSQINDFETFVNSAKTGAFFHFSESCKVLTDRTKLFFFVDTEKVEKFWELNDGQIVKIGNYLVSLVRAERFRDSDRKNQLVEYIDGGSLELPLKIRFWRAGDSFIPLGAKGSVKLSDFFINQKLNLLEKHKVPLILSGEKIVWLAGLRLSELFKITEQTKKIYKIEIKML
jgi:tRNA(Ile)-lysidine synthase